MDNNTAIGPFMLNFDVTKEWPVQFHQFPEMEELSPLEALELLQWLSERREMLISLSRPKQDQEGK